ncbi:GH43 family beta-xylosidase [Microbacterium sp. SORGH_AS 1204]|uniref:family 43 glycosylhydrolase n=1 Tax=Microbacterium sp. SORGH_AS_1204 TaxID=3041785 RepID=UPI00278E2377|nr:family 43 glycosylhydrolase [Microbacterium sp. SORGH_AS_1204]MDQ1135205.1 GH43 family beta-xylosidase [Microbacterium sp. SORGH_AS_1204]
MNRKTSAPARGAFRRRCAGVISSALGFALVVSGVGVSAASAAEPASLVASYDFSETSGTVVRDASGAGRDAAVVGGVAWRGGSMEFTGANHVKLPDGLLAGQSAATIIIETSPTALSGAKFLWNIGGSGNAATGQFFIQPVAPRVAISKTNWAGEQTVTSSTRLAEGRWQSVAATIEKNAGAATSTLRLYIDGALVAQKTDSTTALSDLTTHTMNYIGRSAYTDDSLYQGGVSSFRVYNQALSATDIAAASATDATATASEVVASIDLAGANAQNLSAVETDLSLPTTGGVSWTSSPSGIVAADGKVTRPATRTDVTLTATATVRGKTATRTFTVTVLPPASAAEQAAKAAAALVLPSVLENGYVLPTTAQGLPVAWSHVSGAGSVANGAIASAPATGLAAATLKAVVGSGPDAATTEIPVRIAEAGASRLAAYTTSRNTRGGDDPEVTRSGHLALSSDGTTYTPLNSGAGIVYATSTGMTEQSNGTTRYLGSPYLFRLEGDQGYGLIARRTNAAGAADAAGALVFTSPDLVTWTERGLLPLPGQGTTGAVSAEWDARVNAYRVVWTSAAGSALTGTTTAFQSVTAQGAGQQPGGRSATTGVAYAENATAIPVTAAEARSASDLLGRVHNTGVRAPEAVGLTAGDTLTLPEKVTADYSDGGTHDFGVTWDTSAVDTSKPGTYTATGTLQRTDTNFPLVANRADPHVLRYTLPNGQKTWLYIATDDAGQDEFFIRRSDTIGGISSAADNRILGPGLSGNSVNAQLWAPELHVIDGDLYIMFAANAESANWWAGVQAYTMRLKPGGDPLTRADWEAPQRVVDQAGQPLTTYGQGITLDMTHFEDGGTDYVMWSERVVAPSTGPAVLKIAKVTTKASGSWQLASERSTVAFPDKGWSTNTTPVVEGPFVIQRDGKVMITFSGSGVDWTYGVGLLTAASGANLLDPAAWNLRNSTIWSYEGAFANNWGPGHNSYTYDDDGNLLNVFHAKATQNGSRDSGIRMVYFRQDDTPILDMTDAEWLAAANRTVTATVTVTAPVKPTVQLTASSRCIAGKATLVATVTNTGTAALDAKVSSPFGSTDVTGLAVGKTKSVTFATRTPTLTAGSVTATAAGSGGAVTADYAARSCG